MTDIFHIYFLRVNFEQIILNRSIRLANLKVILESEWVWDEYNPHNHRLNSTFRFKFLFKQKVVIYYLKNNNKTHHRRSFG